MLSPVHSRELSDDECRKIVQCIAGAGLQQLGVEDVRKAQALFLDIEERLAGRIAGPIAEYLVLYFLVQEVASVMPKGAQIVEIGTLFGGSAILMWHAQEGRESRLPIVSIDPLDGYYRSDGSNRSGSNKDIILDLDISEERVISNLRTFGVPPDEVQLQVGLSQDAKSVDRAADRPIALLFIDGDHSLEGVQRDIELYTPYVADGGYVLVDNFFDADWPMVTRGVLSHSNFFSEFKPVICHSRLLVAKKTDSALTPIEAQFRDEFIEYQKLHLEKQAALEFKNAKRRDENASLHAQLEQSTREKALLLAEHETVVESLTSELNTLRRQLADLQAQLEQIQFHVRCYQGELRNREIDIRRLRT